MAIGNQPSLTGNVASKSISVTATAGQTLFTVSGGYRINQISVFRNGSRLVDSLDYTARDGASVTLFSAATLGDVLEFQIFDTFRAADALDVNSGGTVNGNVNITGNLSVTGTTTLSAGSSVSFATTAYNLIGIASTATAAGTAYGLSGTPNITVGTVTGSLTGTASTATAAGTAYGLSGTPNITVGNITGSAATFTNLTVNGTQTIINTQTLEVADKNIGIGSTSSPSNALADGAGLTIYGTTNKTLTYNDTKKALETNIAWATTETRFINVAEKITRIDGNTVSLTYNGATSNIGLCTNPTGDITLTVTGIPTSSDFDNHSVSFAVMVNQTGTARSCTAVTLNGVSATIRWAGGSLASATSGVTTTTGMDIYNFTGINTIGSASTTANYYLLGVVNGGFR